MRAPNIWIQIYHSGNMPPSAPDSREYVFLQDRYRDIDDTEGDQGKRWTAIVQCEERVDFRDDYPGDPSTVFFFTEDGAGDRDRKYQVVFVERHRNPGIRRPHFKMVYADRRKNLGDVVTPCCPDGLPETLQLAWDEDFSLSDLSGACTCTDLGTGSVALEWAESTQCTDAQTEGWTGSLTLADPCGGDGRFCLLCEDQGNGCSDFKLYFSWNDGGGGCSQTLELSPSECTCDPFSLTFAGVTITT